MDRGFDCITPVIHDLTFQSMFYVLLAVNNDVWKYLDPRSNDQKELIFSESTKLWNEFRHHHIAIVNQQLPIRVKAFNAENANMELKVDSENADIKSLAEIVKKLPKYQKEKDGY